MIFIISTWNLLSLDSKLNKFDNRDCRPNYQIKKYSTGCKIFDARNACSQIVKVDTTHATSSGAEIRNFDRMISAHDVWIYKYEWQLQMTHRCMINIRRFLVIYTGDQLRRVDRRIFSWTVAPHVRFHVLSFLKLKQISIEHWTFSVVGQRIWNSLLRNTWNAFSLLIPSSTHLLKIASPPQALFHPILILITTL